MTTTSVLIAGVGGQGLVLATRIISHVAFKMGLNVKTSDVIGLSQRGGMVWGSVRLGAEVAAPLIPKGTGDFLVAMEELEALRWTELMKPGATIILSREVVFPNRVLIEKEDYPEDIDGKLLARGFGVKTVDSQAIAKEIGNIRLANTVLLGVLSSYLPFAVDAWVEVIKENVPPKTIEQNLQAFQRGRELAETSPSPPAPRPS